MNILPHNIHRNVAFLYTDNRVDDGYNDEHDMNARVCGEILYLFMHIETECVKR